MSPDFDVVIVGAGVAGLYQIYKIKNMGLRVKCLETAPKIGGTWYWNRYPGARFDSESWTYGYSFSRELLDEWNWTEDFAPQPETEKYLNYVADKFNLKQCIDFNTKVISAKYDESNDFWIIKTESGKIYTSRFFVPAVGILSAAVMPNIPGVESFKGISYHTHKWPQNDVDLHGKKVGIIGTGATAVQIIPEIAKIVDDLTIFQRTPNWCTPLHNKKIPNDRMQEIKLNYDKILKLCEQTPGCYIHSTDPRSTFEVTEEERLEFWEKLYAEPGFGIWQGNFRDMLTDRAANALIGQFLANKIRSRVKDPAVAENLTPKDHGFGTRRVPQETGYYETFNRENVHLIDINQEPIEEVYENGVRTNFSEISLDVLIYATGFDAITGAFERIDIEGLGGNKLRDIWKDGPLTYLGVLVANFPNMFICMGPHSGLGNYTRTAEYSVEWVSNLIEYAVESQKNRVETTVKGMDEWTGHVMSLGEGLLANEVGSWMTGVNRNLADKQKPKIMRYSGGHPAYREFCNHVKEDSYRNIIFS
ncbi:NAD(P)/FAD-dependent oxidoreductase [Alphaproteobacteria bacterium]|nr:NAD(P)/FAD-dependent oxidoreductase [Alphaproteobacteria bacterium]